MSERIKLAIADAPTMSSQLEFMTKYPGLSAADRLLIWNARVPFKETNLDLGQLHTWQRTAFDTIEYTRNLMITEPLHEDCRKFQWFADPKGGAGKSELITFMEAHYSQMGIKATVLTLRNKDTDWEFLATRDLPSIILINIPRSVESQHIPYYLIENLLDGRVQSSKYQGSESIGKVAIAVFANCMPERVIAGKETMTKDRWNVVELSQEDAPVFNM